MFSFPGGLADSKDASPESTALRELEEELGVMSCDVDVWGRMNNMPDERGTSVITAVIGHIRNYSLQSLRVNPQEVLLLFLLRYVYILLSW